LNNIARHSGASDVEVTVQAIVTEEAGVMGEESDRAADWLRLTVTDDGRGFDPERATPGFGLLGVRERCTSLGGRFLLKTGPGKGVSITVEVPCETDPERTNR